ncbi:MAG: SDR family NAD(P)-dependent oxidoreductase [Candidatus Rokubacteria bacterium]|nr:SDR family NAD(P)-dependent oxidoreductase [Candidatus Rokubacteria bacterium]
MSALAGQVALVTGAGRGIGRAVARALAAEGATVVLAARTRSELAAAAEEIRGAGAQAFAVPTDVTQDRAVGALVDEAVGRFERLDVLVNAAGTASFGTFAESKADDWDGMLAVNLRATMVTCRAVLPVMLRQGRGTIVNVASIAATRPIPGAAVYAATKAGVLTFSRVLAEEVRPAVRVGVVVPGAVDTPLWDTVPGGPDRARMLRPADVARAVVLMAALPSGAALEEVRLLPAGGIL